MTINKHVTEFFGFPVRKFEGKWAGPEVAYRVETTWDDAKTAMRDQLDQLCAQQEIGALKALVIGAWHGDDSQHGSAETIRALVAARDRLTSLRAIFLGDIICEENEISWIEQSDVTPLLSAFPRLEMLRVRGGNNLAFSRTRHENLKTLIVEAGGLRRDVLREIVRCDFPSLEHLELWLGVANYGFDGSVEDLQPYLTGERFPALRYLGLRNSEIVDDIAAVVVNAPILKQLDVLDLSNGTITDVGGKALLNIPASVGLQKLDLTHHYMTEEMVAQLQETLPFEVIADDGQSPDEEWRSVVVSE